MINVAPVPSYHTNIDPKIYFGTDSLEKYQATRPVVESSTPSETR